MKLSTQKPRIKISWTLTMYQHYKNTYSHWYSNFGNLEDLRPCIEYLQEKPKFLSWRVEMHKFEKGDKKPHPIGKKAVQQEQADQKADQKLVAEAHGQE
jgi:hypothetical protein